MDTFTLLSVMLVIATCLAFVMHRLQLPLFLGYILAGIFIGPVGLGLIESVEQVRLLSEIGLSFLLFGIGLSLHPRVLREVGKVALLIGVWQMVVSTLLGYLLGRLLGWPGMTSFFVALAFSWSSTIVVVKLLSERQEMTSLSGKIALGVLLVQDLVAALTLILWSSLGQGAYEGSALLSFAKGLFLTGMLVLASILIIPLITRALAKSQEFLFLFAMGWGLGLAALFHAMGLSIEIGSLIAGATLASSPYQYEIAAKIRLLRDFFLVPFFIFLGAQLGFAGVGAYWVPIVLFSLIVLVGKPLMVNLFLGHLGYHTRVGWKTGLVMAQVSEFSLVFLLLLVQAGLVPPVMLSVATFVALLTITGSALLVRYQPWLLSALTRNGSSTIRDEEASEESYQYVLFGCHRLGEEFLQLFRRREEPFLVVDADPKVVAELTEREIACRYGDLSDPFFLEGFDFSQVKAIVSTVPDAEANALLVQTVQRMNPQCVVIVMAHSVDCAHELYELGATYVVMPHFLGGSYGALCLERYGCDLRQFAKEREKHLSYLAEHAARGASNA